MVRSTEAEFRHRRKLREKYFEDPRYRKWSDIIPGGLNGQFYASMRDDCLFDYYITNQRVTQSNTTKFVSELIGFSIPNIDDTCHTTVKRLLNKYRDHLTTSYDMI